MKHVYRAIIFIIFFIGSVFVFHGNIKETRGADKIKMVEFSKPEFPVMTVKTQGYIVNVLHGYNSNLKASLHRESMTPIGIDQEFQLLIAENKTSVRKLKYELRKVNDNSLMDTGEISVLEEQEEVKVATVKLDAAVEQGREYALKITAITNEGKKIHYFTHLKYYGTDSFLDEKMDFVLDFHNKTFDKSKIDEIGIYLEYASNQKNDTFASVDITSSREMISWGNLKPKVVSEIVPTIKEFNIETASVCLEYFVEIKSGNGKDRCKVKEFFRVRYSGGRMYLLKYERDMETLFDIHATSVSESDFKLGILENSNIPLKYSQDKSRMAFVASRELWMYSLNENIATKVFSFNREEDYIWSAYDQHAIRIINIDTVGNMDFMVYGYMNAGDYEGCVGIVLYRYYAEEKRLEEQVFIPLDTTYQILKENLDPFCYVSDGNVFYFAMDHVIYSYDIVAKRLKVIAKDVEEGNYCYVEQDGVLAWQKNSNDKNSRTVVIMDLETKEKTKIETSDEERIVLIGNIDSNVVYGLIKKTDMNEQEDGSQFTPIYKICIINKSGAVLKEYQQKNIYVEKATIEDNVIQMERVKLVNGVYQKTKPDSIQNQEANMAADMGVTKRITELNLIEYYIYLKAGFVMPKAPTVSSAKATLMTESKIVRVQEKEAKYPRYYVYAEGEILGAYANPAKAIQNAEDAMGVVINQDNQLVYERAGKYRNNQIGSISPITIGNGVTTKGACLAMVLKYNHIPADAEKLSRSKKSAYGLLKDKMGENSNVVNLKGCTLDEVLYFVSGNRPVIAWTEQNTMVLLTEYTESTVTYIDPVAGEKKVLGLRAAEEFFERGKNAFVSYVQ